MENHQGRGDTKRRQAAVLLQRLFQDMGDGRSMTERHDAEFTLNGEAVAATVAARLHLADFLRHARGLTGTHVGCGHGVCGACNVMIDGRSARSS